MSTSPDCESTQTLIDFPRNVAPQKSRDEILAHVAHLEACEPCKTYALRDGVALALDKLEIVQGIHPDID